MRIRRVVGYERLVESAAGQLLPEPYVELRLFINPSQPSFRLKSSVLDRGRIKRQYDSPRILL